jgi:hypothetical protein
MQNNLDNLTGYFGGWRRCSLVIPTSVGTDMLVARAWPAAQIPASSCYLDLLPPPYLL